MLRLPARHRRLLTLTAICVFWVALLLALHFLVRPYQHFEATARDLLSTNDYARRSPLRQDIIYLGIDDASRNLDTLFDEDLAKSPTLRMMKQGFPWNRAVYAAVLERLVTAGARAVVFDLVFPAPRAGDSTFRLALDDYRDRVAIGSNLVTKAEEALSHVSISNKTAHLLPSASLIPPGPPLDSRVGFVNVRQDEDGIVRRIFFRTTLLEFFNLPPDRTAEPLYSIASRALQKAGLETRIPATSDAVLFRFSEPFLPRSLHEIFVEDQWQRPPYNGGAMFKDKIVLIGVMGDSSEDRIPTAHGAMIGPALHLSALNAALNGDFLHETTRTGDAALIIGAGALAGLLGAAIRKPMVRLAVLGLALAGSYALIQWLFNHAGWFPNLLSPLLALAASGLSWSVWEQVLDLLEKARLRRTFERYVSRDVVKELVDNPQGWLNTLGGQRKMITVLFSDVRGFTTITESGDAQALVAQLNEYFDAMVNIVFAHQGTLDKFIGDAVMAQWGGIVTGGEKEDACRAVKTALEMRDALLRLNAAWQKRGMQDLHIGIGVNHGEAIVGNLGAEVKKEVTAIGDAVNIASRLEGMTKQFHVDLLLGETVAPLVRDQFIIRTVALSQPKGKTKPLEIFTVLGLRGPDNVEPAWLAAYEEGVRLFRVREFAAATPQFESTLRALPDDWLGQHYLEVCRAFAAQPPPPEWTPVDVMTSK